MDKKPNEKKVVKTSESLDAFTKEADEYQKMIDAGRQEYAKKVKGSLKKKSKQPSL